MPNRVFRAGLSLAVALLAIAAASAQPPRPPVPPPPPRQTIPGDGSEFLRALLHTRGLKPVKDAELRSLNYRDTLVIVIGNPQLRTAAFPAQHGNSTMLPGMVFRQAMENGGAGLMATSSRVIDPNMLPTIQISGRSVTCLNDEHILRGRYPDCPLVVPLTAAADTPLFRPFGGDPAAGLKPLTRVAAGASSYLTIVKGTGIPIRPLATFPPGCRAEGEKGMNPLAVFAAGAEWEASGGLPSRMVVMASDHVFNNYLLSDKTTQNLELCQRLLEYLQGPDRRLSQCVFFENGRLIEHFNDLANDWALRHPMPMPPIPRLNLEQAQKKTADFANQAIGRLEDAGFPDKLTQGWPGYGPFRTLIIAATVLAILFLLSRVFRSRKAADTPPAPVVSPAATGPPGVFERRQRELLRRQNLFEPVRERVREFFATTWAWNPPGRELPPVRIARGVNRPSSLRLALQDFWKLAYGSPRPLSVAQWRDMEPYFERVCQAHADGKWTFLEWSQA